MLFKNHPLHFARSAGTSSEARIKVNQKLIDWADVIFVMELKHRQILRARFTTFHKEVIVLDIPDEYQFGDETLIELLRLNLVDYL